MKRNSVKHKSVLLQRRHRRIRMKVSGTAARPRLSVFRSSRFVVLQLIDDAKGVTLFSATDRPKKGSKSVTKAVMKRDRALAAGKDLALRAVAKGVKKVVFDRGGYAYHGRVKAAAEGAREGGLEF